MSKKNTNDTTRTGLHFNIIDFVIIIAVIACCAGIYIRYNIGGIDEQQDNHITAKAEFLLTDVSEQLCDALTVGSTVYFNFGNEPKPIGELSMILSKLPAEQFKTLIDGTIVKTYSDELRFDVRGIITLSGVMTEKGFLFNGEIFIAPGTNFNVQTPEADFNCIVTNITLDE